MKPAVRASFALCLGFLVVSSCLDGFPQTSQQPTGPEFLSNDDIRQLVKALPPEVVVAKIRASSARFDVSASQLLRLKDDGVPPVVILAMIERADKVEPPKSAERFSSWQDLIPLAQSAVWPLFLGIVLIAWREKISRLVGALVKKIEHPQSSVDFFGLRITPPEPVPDLAEEFITERPPRSP